MKTIKEILKNIESKRREAEFLPTGFNKIDQFLDGGFLKKELIVLGGPTGRGKSLIAGKIFYNVAKAGFTSAHFSLELSSEMVVSRILGEISGLKPTRVMVGLLTPEEYETLVKARTEVAIYDKLMVFYDDVYVMMEIENEIKKRKYEFVVIDFIQNIIAPNTNEYERLSSISVKLQKLAKEANCAILVLSQLSNVMAREGKSVYVEYRGSGTIATVCDLGFFLEPGKIDEDANRNKFTIKLRKNRRGIAMVAFDYYYDRTTGEIYAA